MINYSDYKKVNGIAFPFVTEVTHIPVCFFGQVFLVPI
ncbi:hypothetical protein SAMN05444267_102559 [Chryseobacterium polytrichastri]|uniref:Uncharacterized protein n=1 Tax=Chryseobacterium polytrichastri TaxID=1302687 RepID=A0A1M7DQ45_9FLAO|nr:hypothetical protein SAMN05444267_102559 [Chryseobacterium polytrichastri]